ncbi:hypothetical protein CEXT_770081 [Caerostris extrusa]|uniref:Uncharacterized protein n=1 Tax=Caerostris extrusa TaxID=172846 RepID=A0AAV4Y1Q9_CAEEX|nr:hypothetical protein CEXT_770081 [Caerostris extrusa]
MKNPVEGRTVVQNGGQPFFGDPPRTRVEYRLLNLVDLKEVLLSAPPNLYDNARLPDYWPDEPFLYPQPRYECVWFKNRRAKWRKQQREEQERHRRIQDERPSRTVDPSEALIHQD